MIVNLDLPQDLYNRAAEIAQKQQLSVTDVLATACAEHIAAWDRLEQRAQRGDRTKFLKALAKVPDLPADEADRVNP